MSRRSWTLSLELCVAIVALSGCGSDSAPSSVGTSAATVNPVGSAPVPAPAKLRAVEDQPVRGRLIATDADDDTITFAVKRSPAHATVTLAGVTGVYELRPAANYFGTDSFEFTASDGHGNSASAQVAIEILPVADAPAIDANAIPAVVAAGSEAHLHVATTDADGDAVTLSVSQVGGSVLPNLRVVGDDIWFLAPAVDAAATAELQFEATDRTGLSTRLRQEIRVSPVSRSGNLYTVKGRPGVEGLHWVITGDGFTADQQQDLLRTAVAIAKGIVETPEIARHSGILNIHVLTAISRDSGVDSGTSHTRRTAFEASLGCGGLARVACLNWDRVHVALIAERVPFDEVAVVLNTGEYVGNASASGLIVSRHPLAPAIALHEMGHLFAGLADEYVDETLAGDLVPQYREGKFPNVTTAADPAQIPWRHWFTDSARIPQAPGESGVGRFEGAFYSPSGFYRPKLDSIMRTLDGALGEVNAEAWLRSFYRAVPPISAAYPAQRVVAAPSGTTVGFEIVSPWPTELMAVRWFVDDVEVPQARDAYQYRMTGDGSEHQVRATIEDTSGSIRAPSASEHRAEASWRLSDSPREAALKVQAGPARVGGWIRVHVDSGGHRVLGTSLGEPQRAPVGHGPTDSDFGYALFDGSGAMLAEGEIADPRLVHGPLAPPGESRVGHAVVTLQSGDYLIGIPEGTDARRLRIRRLGSPEKSSLGEQWLDL